MKWLGYITNAILSTLFSGYAFTILWGWFIVEKFNLPQLHIAEALGVILIATYLTHTPNFTEIDKEDYSTKTLVYSWVKPLAALLFGWIYTLFI